MQIGAQLYTAHNHTKTLEGLAGSLRKVAEIGYKSVQVSGTCPFEPEWLKAELAKSGLDCVITHVPVPRFLEEGADKIVSDHAIFGCRNIGIGMMPKFTDGDAWTVEDYEIFREKFAPVAKRMKELGAVLHYHNHYQEFQGVFAEKNLLDRMLEDFPEGSLQITLDLGWAAWAGQDIEKLIAKYDGYISRIHLKDFFEKIPEGIVEHRVYQRPVLEGELPYEAYINALSKTNCEYMLVEMDSCYDEDEFECLRRSYENVVKVFPNTK